MVTYEKGSDTIGDFITEITPTEHKEIYRKEKLISEIARLQVLLDECNK